MTDNPANEVQFSIDGKLYPFPTTELTLEEAGAVEQITGLTVYEYAALLEEAEITKEPPPVRVMTALIYLAMHREDPRISVKRVLSMTASEVSVVGGDASPPEEAPAPTPTSGEHGRSNETSGSSSNGSSDSSTIEEDEFQGAPV